VQFSAASHVPVDGRQTVVAGSSASAGQAALVPVQLSAGSHVPVDGRHSVSAGTSASVGHVPEDPVQVSATSHAPAEGRHVTVLAWKASTHALLVPAQWSAVSLSHAPPFDAPAQLVVAGWKPSAGQVVLVPVQVSATSQAPTDARQTAPEFPATLLQPVAGTQESTVQALLSSHDWSTPEWHRTSSAPMSGVVGWRRSPSMSSVTAASETPTFSTIAAGPVVGRCRSLFVRNGTADVEASEALSFVAKPSVLV
jgi:hypothetical protein